MTQAQTMLQKYIEAEMAVLDGKEIKFNDRSLRMEDLPEIRAGRAEWEARVAAESAAAAKSTTTIGGRGFSLARFN